MNKEIDKHAISFSAISAYDVDQELATRLETSSEKALRSSDPVYRAKCFYEIQTCRELGNTEDQCQIGVYVNKTVSTYHGHITKTIKDINIAAPGINLYETADDSHAKITIGEGKGKGCYTRGIFKGPDGAYVHLDTDWSDDWKGQTTIHELLHALGFQHEFKRKDAEKYVNINTNDYQYKDKGDHQRIRGLTRFDPFSVMMYPENEDMERLENGDIVWRLKSETTPNKQMSELDKVALNMVFRPCRGNDYNPKIGPTTDMLYCGRSVMTGNQQITPTDTDGRCGPDNWANCPACRVLIDGTKMKCQRMHDKGKWQGWSGLFYCGKKFSTPKKYVKNGTILVHDGVCGPDNGPPCNECGREMYPEYDYSKEVESDDDCVIL